MSKKKKKKPNYIIIFNFIILNGATLGIKDKGLHKFTVSPFRPIIILEIVIVLRWDLALKKKKSEKITTREATTISEGKIVVRGPLEYFRGFYFS